MGLVVRYARYLLSLAREVLAFAREHKVYWIVPMALVLALVLLLVVTSQGAAPFLYTIF